MTAVQRWLRTLVAAVLAVAASGLAVLLTPNAGFQAAADPIESCNTESGVIVVVDFGTLGGGVQRGCASGGGSGLQVLQSSFSVEGTARYRLQFVCRINSKPSSAQQPCVDTPPGDAYWSYWHAEAGDRTWSYSGAGAASARPGPGSVDGWAFGDGSQPPAASPDDMRAKNPPPPPVQQQQEQQADPTPPPAPQTPPAPAPANDAPSAPGSTRANSAPAPGITSAGGAETDGAAPTDSPTPTDSTAPSDSASSSSASASTSASTSGPDVVTVSSAPVAPHDSGSAVPTIIAVLVVVAIGIGAGVVGLRRRGRSASP